MVENNSSLAWLYDVQSLPSNVLVTFHVSFHLVIYNYGLSPCLSSTHQHLLKLIISMFIDSANTRLILAQVQGLSSKVLKPWHANWHTLHTRLLVGYISNLCQLDSSNGIQQSALGLTSNLLHHELPIRNPAVKSKLVNLFSLFEDLFQDSILLLLHISGMDWINKGPLILLDNHLSPSIVLRLYQLKCYQVKSHLTECLKAWLHGHDLC